MTDPADTHETEPPCVFCEIVAGRAEAKVVGNCPDVLVIVPLNPVTEGHVLVIPKRHVADAREDPRLTGLVMSEAAMHSGLVGSCNIITSVGAEATQTVFHLHVHVVPRREGDGLPLPWTPQRVAQTGSDAAGGAT